MDKTSIKAVVALKGGFTSRRGTYICYRVAEREIDGSVVDALELVQEALQEARDKAQRDEIISSEKVEIFKAHPME